MSEFETGNLETSSPHSETRSERNFLHRLRAAALRIAARGLSVLAKDSEGYNRGSYFEDRYKEEEQQRKQKAETPPTPPSAITPETPAVKKLYPKEMFNIGRRGEISVSTRIGPNPNETKDS